MAYLDTMAMLINNVMADIRMQQRIDFARVECGMDQRLQHQLDVKQAALEEVRNRNLFRIAEIASQN